MMMQPRSNRVYPIKRNEEEKEGQSFSDFKELHKRKGEITKESIYNKMSRFTAFSSAVIVLFVLYHGLSYLQRRFVRLRKAQHLRCKEPPHYPHIDPIFGWDLFLENVKAIKGKQFLQRSDDSCKRAPGGNAAAAVCGGAKVLTSTRAVGPRCYG